MEEKKDKIKIITNVLNFIIALATVAIIGIAIYVIVTNDVNRTDTNLNEENLAKIAEVYELLEKKYYGEIDFNEVTEKAIVGMLQGVDDIYTRYVDEEEFSEMLEGVEKEYTGLGIYVNYDSKTKGIMINNVMPESPAEIQGLKAGDILLKVENLTCSAETYYDCIDLIKSPEPTTVHIVYKRNDEILEGNFTTEVVKSKQTVSSVISEEIGYIRMYSFDLGVSDEFKTQYENLRSKNIKGLVIDLRNNPGGLVSETNTILKSILPEGVIVKMVYKDGTEKVYENTNDNKIDIPLVVLVNDASASASEIFAGAVKDLKVGTIIGTKTFGKGIVQTVEPLKLSEGALSITTSRYYTASGHEIHGNGITPDIEVKAKEEYKNAWYIPELEDLELQKAIEVINSEIQK